MNFKNKLKKIQKKNNSLVCCGLDVDLEKISNCVIKRKNPIFSFNREIIDATCDLVCAYKPNIAFYEAGGVNGLKALKETIDYLRKNYSDIPIILDAKRGDIGNTAKKYAQAIFDYWKVDAATIFPFLGYDSVKPFLKPKSNFVIFLIRTSNPDAKQFQDPKVKNERYYLYMAKIIKKWKEKNFGVFCGATYPKELKKIRSLFPARPILTAGIGAQGGKAKLAVKAGVDKDGLNLICNSSRSIIYAGKGKNFAKKARIACERLKEEINRHR